MQHNRTQYLHHLCLPHVPKATSEAPLPFDDVVVLYPFPLQLHAPQHFDHSVKENNELLRLNETSLSHLPTPQSFHPTS